MLAWACELVSMWALFSFGSWMSLWACLLRCFLMWTVWISFLGSMNHARLAVRIIWLCFDWISFSIAWFGPEVNVVETTVIPTEGAHEHNLLIDCEFQLILLKHKSEKTIRIVWVTYTWIMFRIELGLFFNEDFQYQRSNAINLSGIGGQSF